MRYGIFFTVIATSLTASAIIHGGWYVLAVWPALSFALVAIGYFHTGPSIFGKARDGKLALANQLILLPYLVCIWSVWRLIRVVTREASYDHLTENIVIGRRLLSHEFPSDIAQVVDLTCEFNEPVALRSRSYLSFPILDAGTPSLEHLRLWVQQTSQLSGRIYIHCAEGHGRTGLFAAALLLQLEHSRSPTDAIMFIQSKRPHVRLTKQQFNMLSAFDELLGKTELTG